MKTIPRSADSDNATTISSSITPTITIINEVHPPIMTDLDLRAKGLSAALARKVCFEAGGRVVGKRVLVATSDLLDYLRAHPPKPRVPRAVRQKPANDDASLEAIGQANRFRVLDGGAR